MKRRVICIFTLVFWMIALSTFLSIRIEQWMTPIISTVEAEELIPEVYTIPADALSYDDMGAHLYRTREGSGWEKGRRVYEVDMGQYTVQGDQLEMQYAGTFIRYATRDLREGEVVTTPEEIEFAADRWVAIYPEEIPAYQLEKEDMKVETKTDNAMLVTVPKANVPFMEDRAREWIGEEKDEFYYLEAPTSKVYSLNDLEQFMDCMVLLGILAAAILLTVILWGWSFRLSCDYRKNKKWLLINGGAAAVILALTPLLLHFIDIPNSLLPQYHITDFAHYGRVFGELFDTLHKLADSGSAVAGEAIRYAEGCVAWFFVLLGAGILLGAAAIIAEVVLSKDQKKGKIYLR